MTALSVSPAFPIFTDRAGQPLENGYVWIGAANLPPQTNPIAVFWDAALSQPAAQPVRTINGYPSNSGSPGRLYVGSDYSLLVQDAKGSLVYSAPASTERLGDISAEDVLFQQDGAGSVIRTVQSKLRETISPDDKGAVGDGVVDDTAAFTAAMADLVLVGGGTLRLDGAKTYLLNGGAASPDGYKNGIHIPFSTVNADPSTSIIIEGNGARLRCGSNNMILIRNSRNCTTVRDVTLDYNGKTGVFLCLTGPEDMTQTTALVSNSFLTMENVNRLGGPSVDGLVFMPGPYVGGSDSGAFYHNIIGGYSNFIGGGRHVWARKNVNWASFPNWMTRTNFIGQRLTRGNVGYHFEDGSECTFYGCNEEGINSGTTPIATPTARVFEAPCDAMQFFGGYSEACTESVSVASPSAIESWGYKPVSGSDAAWITNASSWADAISDNRAWTPVVNSSGGGSQGASTSFGRAVKQGKMVYVVAQISVAKGTLGAGTISIAGVPYVADSSWQSADFQGLPVTKWAGVTLGANWVGLVAYISGATISVRKLHAAGANTALLTIAECADPIELTVSGWYKVA